MISKKYIQGALSLVIAFAVCIQASVPVSAADARNFQAGRIIDDGVFTNSNSMTVANIQSFFNSKVTCDTYGAKTSELGGGTRAQWLAANGYSTPVTCLRDFYENPTTGANNYGRAIPAGAISAAQIIYNYSQQFSINPQALIVKLQKEQGLVTDEWPTPKQYTQALGFGCPDNLPPGAPACNPSYGGFSTQVYQAARLLRGFINNTPGWYIPFTIGINSIRWSPTASCGSGSVNIQNRSTVALYGYTPYQPNQAALNAQYGRGDGCSAYGNRNFYMYFTDWFGSVFGGDPVSNNLRLTSPIATSPANPVAGQTVTISYTVRNFGSSTINYDNSLLQCRLSSTYNCDSGSNGPDIITAGQSKVITHNITLTHGGNYNIIPYIFYGGLWQRLGVESPIQNNKTFSVPNIPITSPVTISPHQPVVGQPVSISYTVRNNGTQPVNYQNSVLQCRDEDSNNCDSSYSGPLTLNPGENRTFTQSVTPSTDGNYTLTPYFLMNDVWYTYITDQPSITMPVTDVRLTGEIVTSPTTPIPGQAITVNYNARNFGTKPVNITSSVLQCRINNATNCDPSPSGSHILNAGETKAYSVELAPSKDGTYRLLPYYLVGDKWYEVAKGVVVSNIKNVIVPRYVADMRIVGNINITPSYAIPGDTIDVSYTVKNFGSLPAIYQDSLLQCRFNTNTNCDSSGTGSITINPGATYDFDYTITSSARQGVYRIVPYYMQNGDWHAYGHEAESSNAKTVTVQAYTPDLRLTGDIVLSPSNPTLGQSVSATYNLRNFGSKTVNYDASVLQCRRNTNINCDPSWAPGDSLDPGETKSFTTALGPIQTGLYKLLPYYLYNNQWYEFGKGVASSNVKQFTIN